MCPGAPLLVPGLAPGLASTVPELTDSCRSAIVALTGVDRIVLLTSGPRMRDLGVRAHQPAVVHPPGTRITTAGLTGSRWPAHFDAELSGGPSELPSSTERPPPGVGVIVGAALLAASGLDIPTVAIELSDDQACSDHVLKAVALPDVPVGVLVVGEGSAARGDESPNGGSAGAAALDHRLSAALASGDPHALAAVVAAVRSAADQLMFTAGPSFLALAALTADQPPDAAQLLYDAAPFGVGYLVATWSFARPTG